MAVSDESGADKPKREMILRSPEQWAMIRAKYETGDLSIRDLAKETGISVSTLTKKAWKERWQKTRGLILDAKRQAENAMKQALPAALQLAGEQAAADLADRLTPIIERAKAEHIETQILRSNGHLSRLDAFLKRKAPMEPKDEAYLSKAINSHVTDLRRTLGMGDSGGISGNLNVQILAGQAAVSVSQS